MAIYDAGTASLAANGTVTGVGTTWQAPLTLIRVGATIVFKTEPVKIYTISEIISDTQINVYNPKSETAPAGTGYAILAHDGITVQGLAQDVAETLRYYQSRETEVSTAVDIFKDFDQDKFSSDVSQVNTQFGEIAAIGAQVSSDAAQVTTDKNAAAASAISASADKDAAAASAQEAAGYAASLDAQNLLRKDLALSDLTDKQLARQNLDVYSRGEIQGLLNREVASVSILRQTEPGFDGEKISLVSYLAGTNLGGGIFRSVIDASSLVDNNGTVIKTSNGAAWIRESKSEVYAVDFGFVPNNQYFAASNSTSLINAARYAFEIGSCCILPPGNSYINSTIFDFPANITGSYPGSGASLVQRDQTSDLIHLGSGFCFDFTPQFRPNVPADSASVVDGVRVANINFRGTNSGRGGIRVNTPESINTVGYERRNTTFVNVNIAGYYSGWGYQLFNTFSNHMFNVTVWDCAAIYYIRTSHSTDHISCVYENCAWGCLAINTECNNHIGGAIEGVRYLAKMTKPVDYDENGNFPTDLGYSQLYAGIGIRTRGGTTLLSGVYIEANKIDMHLEDACKVTARDCYFNAVSGRTEFNAIGTSGSLVVQGCRFVNPPSVSRWRRNSSTLLCSHAIITQNQYDSARPTSAPDISNVGEFDVYPGTPDLNAVIRVMKSQGNLTSGNTTSGSLNVDGSVILSGLTTSVPTISGQLYIDSNGFVKRKQ